MNTVKQLKVESRAVNQKPTSKHSAGAPPKKQAPSNAQKGAKTAPAQTKDVKERKTIRMQTEDVARTSQVTFADMDIKPELLRGLNEYGFYQPTPIQEKTIPLAFQNRSIIARAKNGTGKTGSFLIPILDMFEKDKNYVQALIVVSTRELALQVAEICRTIGKYRGVRVSSHVGGISLAEDINQLKAPLKPHVVVGTLGRLAQLVDMGKLDLSKVTMVVFDEADETIAQAIDSTEAILKTIKADFRMSLFSATYPHNLNHFTKKWAKDIFSMNVMEELTLRGVTQYYSYVEDRIKIPVLNTLLKTLTIHQCMIFTNTVERCEQLAKHIQENYPGDCLCIHAALPQIQRNKIFETFRSGRVKFLVSTDVFTRGIDIPNVNVVINFDFPLQSPQYLHRIGRSGRYGQRGLAINLVTKNDLELFEVVQQEIQSVIGPIPKTIDPSLYAE